MIINRVFLNGGSSIGPPYWLGAATNITFQSISLDTSANVLAFGDQNVQTAGNVDYELFKTDNTGSEVWQRRLGDSFSQGNASNRARLSGTDSSGNTYFTGFGPTNTGIVAKYGADGTLQWQKTVGSYTSFQPQALTVDSSGNVYFAFVYYTGSRLNGVLCKINNNGTLAWATEIIDQETSVNIWTIAVNSSGSTIALGGRIDTGGAGLPFVMKFNSSGTKTWDYVFFFSDTVFQVWDCCFDASDNIYLTGPSGSGYTATTLKFWSFNAGAWWYTWTPPSGFMTAYTITTDPSGNVFIGGQGNAGYIIKYDTNGSILWQRSLTYNSASNTFPRSFTCDTSGNLYFTGWVSTSPNNVGMIGKLPGNGTLTGTYGLWNYASISGTSSTPSLNQQSRTITTSGFSPTVSNASYTDAATTLTWTRTTL